MSPLESTGQRSPAHRASYQVPALTSTSTQPVDELFATLVEAAFDLLTEIGEIDLALYLHVPHRDQPVLYTRAPNLASLTPSANFRLMHTVTMLTNGKKPFAPFRHGDVEGHYVRTGGPFSDGIFVFGPIHQPDVADRMHTATRSIARVLHQFHLDEATTQQRAPHVALDEVDDLLRCDITITQADGTRLAGVSTGAEAENTVARATINAIGSGHTLDELRTVSLGFRTGILALLRDSRHQLQLGLAFSNGDLLETVALATTRAISETDSYE